MLKVTEIITGYGKKDVIFGASLEIAEGEIVSIIGPNGAGKSTLLKAVAGLLPVKAGTIHYDGDSAIHKLKPSEIVMNGVGFVPQGNRVFTELSVMENLEVGGHYLKGRELDTGIKEVFNLFPSLEERKHQNAGSLSGGEKQMLALGRALVTRPKLLLLDEPSLGLSPKLFKAVMEKIKEINGTFGTTFLIVEQKVKEILKISNRVYMLKLGKVAFEGTPEALLEKDDIHRLFLS